MRVLVFGLAAGLCVSLARAEEPKLPLAKNPPRVAIDANRMRFTKTTGGDGFDDKIQKVQLEVIVKNLDLNAKSIAGLTLDFWALAQSVTDRKACKVIDRGTFDVTLDNTATGREVRSKGQEVTLELDDTGSAKYGYTYKGYVLVLLNAQREVVAVKANQPIWQTNFQRAFALKTGSMCDMSLNPLSTPVR